MVINTAKSSAPSYINDVLRGVINTPKVPIIMCLWKDKKVRRLSPSDLMEKEEPLGSICCLNGVLHLINHNPEFCNKYCWFCFL